MDSIPAEPLIPGDMPKEIVEQLKSIAKKGTAWSEEQCGFVCCDGGKWFLKQIRNTHAIPDSNFQMDMEEQKDFVISSLDVIAGIYHTHPSGNATRSYRDKAGFSYSTGWRYWIAVDNAVVEYKVNPKDGSVRPYVAR